MRPVAIVHKNEAANADSSAPYAISLSEGSEESLISMIAKARKTLIKDPSFGSIKLSCTPAILEYDDEENDTTESSVYDYSVEVTRNTVYIEGVNQSFSESVIDVYADEIVKDLETKITAYNNLSLNSRRIETILKTFVAGQVLSNEASAEAYDSVMEYDDESGLEPPYTVWQPFEHFSNEDLCINMENMESCLRDTLEEITNLISSRDLKAEIVHHATRMIDDNPNISAGTQYQEILNIANKMILSGLIDTDTEDIDEVVAGNIGRYVAQTHLLTVGNKLSENNKDDLLFACKANTADQMSTQKP